MKIDFELRLMEVEMEISYFSSSLRLLKNNINKITFDEMQKELSGLELNDLNDCMISRQISDWYESGSATRFIINSQFISLWAILESGLNGISEFLRKHKNITLKVNDLKGNIIERVQKYFKDVLNFDLHWEPEFILDIQKLYELRNFLAHTAAKIPDSYYSYDEKDKFVVYLKSQSGLHADDVGNLLISVDFLFDKTAIISDILLTLRKRVLTFVNTSDPAPRHS